uniref:Candidate secreted effector n=3 Tax=Meloidogyne TaxID=189290 RepID=A0A914LFC4_MELIC
MKKEILVSKMQQLQKVSTGFSTATLFFLSVSIVFVCSLVVGVNCCKKKKRRRRHARRANNKNNTNNSNNDRMIKGSKTRAFFQRLNPLEETNETDLGSLDDVDLSKEVPTPKSFRLDLKSKRIKDENIKIEHSQPTISQQTGTFR